MKPSLALALVALLSGCLIGPNLSRISPGMTKPEVIAALGPPKDTAVQGRTEYLTYEGEASYADGRLGGKFYFVRLIDGRVESFGRVGDFDSTKNPAVDYNINQKVTEQSITTQNQPSDLYTELKKLQAMRDEKLITEEEFQALKKRAIERSQK